MNTLLLRQPARCLAVRLATTGALLASLTGLLVVQPAAAHDAGTIVSAVCTNCHGADGNGVAPYFPKLAGQRPEYLAKQLKEFLVGKRTNEVMAPVLPGLAGEDIPALSAYYAGQKPSRAPVDEPGLGEMGKKIYDDGNEDSGVPACVGCHQANAAGSERAPRLAGQFPAYLVRQLASFKSGARTNDNGRLMRVVAARMNDEEIQAVAQYLAGLP